jgi:hypothetical protein
VRDRSIAALTCGLVGDACSALQIDVPLSSDSADKSGELASLLHEPADDDASYFFDDDASSALGR